MGVSNRPLFEILKIAASFLLAMTRSFMRLPFVAALGYKNSCHREERSDLQLFICL